MLILNALTPALRATPLPEIEELKGRGGLIVTVVFSYSKSHLSQKPSPLSIRQNGRGCAVARVRALSGITLEFFLTNDYFLRTVISSPLSIWQKTF